MLKLYQIRLFSLCWYSTAITQDTEAAFPPSDCKCSTVHTVGTSKQSVYV
jgi:hypothetical protein